MFPPDDRAQMLYQVSLAVRLNVKLETILVTADQR